MSETVEKLKERIEMLTNQERAEIARFVIDSLDQETDDDAEAAWEMELARRMSDIDGGRLVGEPADQVFAELRQRNMNEMMRARPTKERHR